MTHAHSYRTTKGKDNRDYRFIDGIRVSESRFKDSHRRSEAIKSQPRNPVSGRYLEKPPSLQPAPPVEIRPIEPVPGLHRYASKIRARPKEGRVGDEYVIVTVVVEGTSMPTEFEWFELSNEARPDLVAFYVKESREI